MNTSEQIAVISDLIVYNQHYALCYPEEDNTNLEREFSKIHGRFLEIIPLVESKAKAEWLSLSLRDVEAGFESYRNGNEEQGWRLLDSAYSFLKNARTGKSHAPDFIVTPDGDISKT